MARFSLDCANMTLNRKNLPRKSLRVTTLLLSVMAWSLNSPSIHADGIYRNGIGARSMSMGGADVGYAPDALGAMGTDPGALGFIHDNEANLGLFGGVVEGEFVKSPTSDGHLDTSLNGLPEGALAFPLGKLPITLGISTVPESTLLAHWRYVDPPGGANGTFSYGLQTDKSEILNLRNAIGLGVAFSDKFSFGASFGADYNQNELITPFIFQSAPHLKTAKVLLDLTTSGWGYNGMAGFSFRPLTNLQFGLSYESPTRIYSQGSASGQVNASQIGVPVILPFHYHAQVRNVFPQMIEAGTSWGFLPQWRLALQLDWVNWGDAFQTLPVALSQGSNPTVNAVAGGNATQDNVPLNWHNEFVYRTGVEYMLTENWALRAGYCYSPSPVPDSTLNPMTAAINEHTLSAGVGYHWGRWTADLAYQYAIPMTRNVGTSGLLDGEYSNSSVQVDMHLFELTLGVTF